MGTSRDARLANLVGAVATGLSDAVHDAALTAGGVDTRSATALVALLDFAPSGSVHVLSQIVGLTHSGGVRLVDRLAGAGYVRRGTGADARSITVELTPPGRMLAEQIRRRRVDAIDALLTDLTDEQRSELTRTCELLIAHLTNERLDRRASGHAPSGGALCRLCDFDACGRKTATCPAAAAAGGRAAGRS